MRKKGKGQLLILVLGVMAMGMLVVAPLLSYVDLSLRLSLRSNIGTSAYYAAESGIQLVIGDLYMAQDILERSNQSLYSGTLNSYDFVTTAEPYYTGADMETTESSAYFDPGVFFMRPMPQANISPAFQFVTYKGKDVKINWAGFTSGPGSTNKDPYDTTNTTTERLNTSICLYDSKGKEIICKPMTTEEQAASNEGRLVANTLLVPGANISGGTYCISFRNSAKRLISGSWTDSYACSQWFGKDSDAELYTLNGSIVNTFTGGTWHNCSDFIKGDGEVTLMLINQDNGDLATNISTFSFFCDYVSLTVTATNISGNTTTNTYTYNGTVSGGIGGNKSYTGAVTVGSGSDAGNPGSSAYHTPSWYGGNYYDWQNAYDYYANNVLTRLPSGNYSELTTDQYSNISSVDGNRMLATDPRPSLKNACLWHVFDIAENPNTVTRLDVHWEGYQTKMAPAWSWAWWTEATERADNDELYLLMWNYEMSKTTPTYHILDRGERDAGLTWVRVLQGGYADYLLTSTSSRDGKDAVTITAYIRQAPGPSVWWEKQSLDILSWNVHIHTD